MQLTGFNIIPFAYHRVVLSDGVHHCLAMWPAQLNERIKSGIVCQYSIVQLLVSPVSHVDVTPATLRRQASALSHLLGKHTISIRDGFPLPPFCMPRSTRVGQ